MKYIEPLYFFIALFIGIFFVYISTPVPDIVIKYPTPDNVKELIYKDSAGICYKYNAEEITCPHDRSTIKKMDIQYTDNDEKNNEDLISKIKQKIGI
jgi:hypothetical protein